MNQAEIFYNEYVKKVDLTCTLDEYKKGGSHFTEKITNIIAEIIKEKLNCTVQKEYYRIDVIGWCDRNQEISEEAQAIQLNPHLWDLEVAVEHENNKLDWTDELVKLTHIRCPLKIIIGYNSFDQRHEDQKKLNLAAKWMRSVKAYDPKANEDYLIILGNASSKNNKGSYTEFNYIGYIYNYESDSFEKL